MKKNKSKNIKSDPKQLKISFFCVNNKRQAKNEVAAIDSSCVITKEVTGNVKPNPEEHVNVHHSQIEVTASDRKRKISEIVILKDEEGRVPINDDAMLIHNDANIVQQLEERSSIWKSKRNIPFESPDLIFETPGRDKKIKKKRKLDFEGTVVDVDQVKEKEASDDHLDEALSFIEKEHSMLLKSLENTKSKCVASEKPIMDMKTVEIIDDECDFKTADNSFIENTPPLTQNLIKPVKLRLKNKEKFKPKSESFLQVEGTTEAVNAHCSYVDDVLWSNESLLSFDDETQSIDLSSCVKCKIMNFKMHDTKWERIITINSVEEGITNICVLRGVWVNSPIKENDIVTIKAKKEENEWVIDNNYGFICLSPDVLLSSTALTGAMFCRRKGVLTTLFKGLESDNRYMIIGKLVHELLQMCLTNKVTKSEEIGQCLDKCFGSLNNLKSLYFCNISVDEISQELSLYKEKIYNFIRDYVTQETTPANSEFFQGKITDIVDIEESIIAPKLGVKGRIDVTVRIHSNNRSRKLPLELKTGRASFSNEHKAQVTLYTMMLSDLGENVDSGLLLYLKEGIMKEIVPSYQEKRDLILLRNDLVRHLNTKGVGLDSKSIFGVPFLPDPISIRKGCEKCSFLTVCSTFLKSERFEQLSPNHPMRTLSLTSTSHLTQMHVDYFLHWCGLLFLEDSNNDDSQDSKSKTKAEREKEGTCLSDLHLEKVIESGEGYLHTFSKAKNFSTDNRINCEDYVVVSTSNQYSVSGGRVVDIVANKCTLMMFIDLSKCFADGKFNIDLCQSKSLLFSYFTNLGHLIENTEVSQRLRTIIIDKLNPSFDKQLQKSILLKGMEILSFLNEHQQRAVLKSLAANDYVLIKGMPGCGKTQTVVALIKLLVSLRKSVLITSHTHSAVDNVLLRLLKEKIKFLRIGPMSRIHTNVRDYSETELIKQCKTLNDVKDMYENCLVVGATCLTNHDLFSKRTFDYCLVDESTQITQAEIIRPLLCCKTFVFIGDPNQLRPVVKNNQAKQLGMDESLFSRLENESCTVALSLQYRMNRVINDLASKLAYENCLKCGTEEIAEAVLKVSNVTKQEEWLEKILSPRIEDSVIFLDTNNICKSLSESNYSEDIPCTNKLEITLISRILNVLKTHGISMEKVGIISPYRAQVQLLNKKLNQGTNEVVEVNTVDQYQGRDKDVIIYSCTRNSNAHESEILNDKRRLTVAITRAKHKLILIGNTSLLIQYRHFAELIKNISVDHIVDISDRYSEFKVETLIKNL